jgi:hypothetical protein
MKYILTIIFLVFSFIAKCQIESLFVNRVDSSNHENYYKRLLKNINQENIDSSSEAINLIFDLHKFDSKKYRSNLLNPFLKQIQDFQIAFFRKTIIGKWQSESLGSNWSVTKEDMIIPNKGFVFNNSEAILYLRDSLIRKTLYSIISKEEVHNDLKFKRFSIIFTDTKEEWSLHFITIGNGVPFHGTAQKLYLLFIVVRDKKIKGGFSTLLYYT